MKNQTPLRYPGGKSKTYPYIRELVKINRCQTYIEPYAGGAGVAIKLLLNNDVKKIWINDYDKSIYAFWYSVLNHTKKIIKLIQDTPITMNEWYKQREVQLNKKSESLSLLELGFSTLFLNRTNRSGILKAGVIGGKKQNGDYKLDCRFNKVDIINRIENISKLKNRIILTNKDAIDFINQNIIKTKNSLTFFDPPYYVKGPGLYTDFYNHEDHKSLAKNISQKMTNNHWILTYDVSNVIEELYIQYESRKYYLNYSIGKPNKGQEFIFFSKQLQHGKIEKYLKLL